MTAKTHTKKPVRAITCQHLIFKKDNFKKKEFSQ